MSAGGFIHFGKYELLSRINIGGMAEIVKACDTSAASRPLVAVKRILPHLCDDAQYRTMFLDESRVLAQLDHPNIIHSFEIGEVEGTPYIAMDFVDGQDARTLFHKTREAEQRVPIAIACYIMACVCEGLEHAHEKKDAKGKLLGLVHRDVSLQNILLSYAGDVKITDFGIAVSSQNEARTEVGIVKGKFGYMSPEQIRGQPLDRRSDIFGAGICLYELLTGERLFWGDSDYKAIERVRNVSIDPPSKLNRNIPSELERIVMKALAKQPKDRYQSALDLQNELSAFMASADERCTPADLGAYLRTVFASEYDSDTESATTIDSNPELDAARAALTSSKDLSAPIGVALDGTTGLGAFDHLDPVSSVSFAIEPDVPSESFAQRPAAKTLPSLRSARQATLPPPGLQQKPAPAAPPTPSQTLRPAAAPQVPPVVPRPDSVPGTQTSSELLGEAKAQTNDNALPDPQPMAMDWDEAEPTTVSKGFTPVMAMPTAAADSFDPDEAPTNVRLAEAMPAPVGSAFDSDAYTPSEPQKPFLQDVPSWRGKATLRMPRVHGSPLKLDPRLQVKLVGAVVVALVLVAASLYWSRSRGPATIRLTTDPRDAIVTVDGTRVPSTASPFVLSGLDPSVAHTIAVEKNGYLGWASRLSLGANQVLDLPLIKLELEVTPLPAAPAPPAALIPAAPEPPSTETPAVSAEPGSSKKSKERAAAQSGGTRASPEKAARPAPPERDKRAAKSATTKAAPQTAPPKRSVEAAAPAKSSGGGTGTLRVNSRPWSRVIIDGRLIGNTPQMSIQLSAGKHALNLVNPEFGIDKTVYVEIKAGETVTRVVTLQ